jgi:hypothetical protein
MFVVYDVGWIQGSVVRRGVPIRMGLVWKADPGVTFVTARTNCLDLASPGSITLASCDTLIKHRFTRPSSG